MKSFIPVFCILVFIAACNEKPAVDKQIETNTVTGTWKLVTAKKIIKNDTTITFPVPGQEVIKLFNGTHFAFFKHDFTKGKDSTAIFEAGSGTYTLNGEDYKERLEYCNYREWEKTDFHFRLQIRKDTLIQQGIEKIDSLNINQEIIEIYTRF